MSEKCKKCGDRLFDEDGQDYGQGGYCLTVECQCARAEAAELAQQKEVADHTLRINGVLRILNDGEETWKHVERSQP